MSKRSRWLLGSSIVLAMIAAGCVGSRLFRSPSLEDQVGQEFLIALYNDTGQRGPVQRLCHDDKAGAVADDGFPGGTVSDPNTIKWAKVTILSQTPIDDARGRATARVSGITLSRERYKTRHELVRLDGAPACSGTISFDYRFYLDDNGRSAVRRTDSTNLEVTGG